MGKPLHRDLELVKKFWREKLQKGSAKEKMRAVLHLERIALEELKHKRSAKIQKAKAANAAADPIPDLANDPEPPKDPYDRDGTYRREHDAWLQRHPEMAHRVRPTP